MWKTGLSPGLSRSCGGAGGDPGLAAASKRGQVSASGITSVAATGVLTLPAGFLDSLEAGDVVSLSGLTGGSAYTFGTDYYPVGALVWPAGQTTVQLSATYQGPPITGGPAITAGTI